MRLTEKLIKTLGPGKYYDGRNLVLQVRPGGSKNWILRIQADGRRTDYGLGGHPDVPLALARERAHELRRAIKQGKPPPRKQSGTLADHMETYLDARRSGWRSPKSEPQFRASLEQHAPALLRKRARAVTREDVRAVLEPIWLSKAETAGRVRARLEALLNFAAVAEHDSNRVNPAALKPHLIHLLPRRPRRIPHHFAALNYRELPGFWEELNLMEGAGAAALRFVILTAARSGEVRGATWEEIGDDGWWRIPAGRMKAGHAHDVYLTPAARALLGERGRGLLFPSPKGKPLSDMTLSAVLRRMDRAVTVHGFRSTFRDWAAEQTAEGRDIAEMCLAHRLKNRVEASYFRSRLDEKRAALLTAWAAFVIGVSNESSAID